MNKTTLIAVTFTIGLLAKPMTANAQADYDLQIVKYPGSTSTQLWGINNRGNVVGNGDDCDPFIYDPKNSTFTDVMPVAGYECTSILGISNSGILAGVVRSDGVESGLILDKKGNTIIFDHPDTVFGTEARDINNDGFVTGIAFMEGTEEIGRGFIYDPVADTFTDIVPSVLTIPQGINEDGYVVGSALFISGSGPADPCGGSDLIKYYGWLRAPDGTVTFFDVNGEQTRARDITDSRTITGWTSNFDTGEIKSFVTMLDGTQCQSLTIPDSELLIGPEVSSRSAQGISNSGVVVGSDLNSGQGFIATPQ